MAYKRNIEIFEEAYEKKDNKSVLSYVAKDGHRRYIAGSEDPDGSDDIQLKTINETSLKGTGNISLVSSVKTVNGQTMTGEGNVSTEIPVVTVSGATPTQALSPNTFYRFGTVTSLTLTKVLPTFGILNIYAFSFTAGDSFDASTDITWPDGVVLDREMELEAGQFCEVSILDDHATFVAWPAPEVPDAPADPAEDTDS